MKKKLVKKTWKAMLSAVVLALIGEAANCMKLNFVAKAHNAGNLTVARFDREAQAISIGSHTLTQEMVNQALGCGDADARGRNITRSYVLVVRVADGTVCIDDGCFDGFERLTTVDLPGNLETIGTLCFKDSRRLREILLPEHLKSLGSGCFLGSALTTVRFPAALKVIGDDCFKGCFYLKSIFIPQNASKILLGASCFCLCRALTCIDDLIAATKGIGASCFKGCTHLEVVQFPFYAKVPAHCFALSGLTNIILPDYVKKLCTGSFGGCHSLTNITIPNSVVALGSSCFACCSSLMKIVIPDGVTQLLDWCFKGCSSLVNVVLPDNLTKISQGCFYDCSSLVNIRIPNYVTSVGRDCFYGCLSLQNISIRCVSVILATMSTGFNPSIDPEMLPQL